VKSVRTWRPNIFAVVEIALTLASLALVAVTMGQKLGAMLHLDGNGGDVVAWSIALVFDALWIGALRMSEQAIRQRSVLGMAVMLGFAAAAVAGSTTILLKMGHVAVFSLAPVAAASFMALRLFAEHALADPETSKRIAEATAEDRNAEAEAHSGARRLRAEAERGVVHETAGHLAEAQRQVVRAEILTKTQKKINKARAEAEKRLTKSEESDGKAAKAFSARTLDVLSPSADAAAGAEGLYRPVPGAVPQVSAGIEAGTGEPVPDAVPAVPDPEETFEPVLAEGAMSLDDVAAVAGVDAPAPGEVGLSDEQIATVLRWLRYRTEPPRGYREAVSAFRAAGFRGGQEKIRTAWHALDKAESAVNEA
jgi:hypothetical protein